MNKCIMFDSNLIKEWRHKKKRRKKIENKKVARNYLRAQDRQ